MRRLVLRTCPIRNVLGECDGFVGEINDISKYVNPAARKALTHQVCTRGFPYNSATQEAVG